MDKCESCAFYNYDEAYDDYVCEMDLDEDEMARFLSGHSEACPYWRPGDEYRTARKHCCQNQNIPKRFVTKIR